MEKEPDIRELFNRAKERAKHEDEKTFMFVVEITKEYSDGSGETKTIKCENTKELYNYVLTDFLETTLERAREELTQNEFTSLCLNVCGFMAEYFT